ncbi:uncharacterized protein [Erythrolamprus reginae]
MWGLLATLLFSAFGCLVDAACPRTNHYNLNGTCLNVSGNFDSPEVNFSMWRNQLKELDLSNNKITTLTELKSAEKLESLFLHHNNLKSLPPDFFDKTPNLKVLRLEKNQLGSLSIEGSYHCLTELRFDCHCNMASSIWHYCLNCSNQGTTCQCSSSEGLYNVTDNLMMNCSTGIGYGLYVGIIVPILVLLLLAFLAFFVIRRKKGVLINQEKRPSNTSEGASEQSRYISPFPLPGSTFRDMERHKDYENVLHDLPKDKVGKMKSGQGNHQRRKQTTPKRSPSEGENADSSEGHQPVYANTHELYYNCSKKSIPETVEDVYIIPDQ